MKPIAQKALDIFLKGWSIVATVILVWILIYAFIPDTPDDQVVEAVKTIRTADKNIRQNIDVIARNAKEINKSYETIQKNGKSRFYSEYDIEISSGSLTISQHTYESK